MTPVLRRAGRTLLTAAVGAALAATAAAAPAAGDATVSDTAHVSATPLKIMPLGDSITFGEGSLTSNSYRIDLQNRLEAAGLDVDFVGSQRAGAPATADLDNEGHPGWTIEKIAAELTGWLTTYRPDVVLLMIGTNDMNRNIDVANAPARLAALIDQIHATVPAARIFVQQLTSAKVRPDIQARIDAYNAAMPAVLDGKGPLVHLVDQSGIRGLLLSDKLHPNDFGYAKMSYNLYRAMEQVLNVAGTPWPTGVNPFQVTRAELCFRPINKVESGRTYYWYDSWDCAQWYYREAAATTADEASVATKRWQRQRAVAEPYRAWVAGHWTYRLKTVDGTRKRARSWVKGRYVTKTRRVVRWVSY